MFVLIACKEIAPQPERVNCLLETTRVQIMTKVAEILKQEFQ